MFCWLVRLLHAPRSWLHAVFTMLGALGTTLFFALTAVFANRAAGLLGSLRANCLRLLLAVLILGVWAHLAGAGLGGASLRWFLLSGVVGFGIGGVAMFQALPRLGSALAMLLVQCGSALVAAGIEWGWLGTRLSALEVALVVLTLTGVTVSLLPLSLPPMHGSVFWRGVAWALTSACGQGAGAVLSRKAFAVARAVQEHPDPASAAYQRAIGGVLVAVLVLLADRFLRRSPEPAPSQGALARAWPWVLGNSLTGPVLGVTCFQWALSTTPAGIVQSVVATAPLATIPLAAWLEGLRPRRTYYLGAVLAVAGVAGLFLRASVPF